MSRPRHNGRWARVGLLVLLLLSLLSVAPPWWPLLDLLAPWQVLFAAAYLVVWLALRLWPRFEAAFWKPKRAVVLVGAAFFLHAGQLAWLWVPSFHAIADENPAEFDLLWWNLMYDSEGRSAQFRFLQDTTTDLVALSEVPDPLSEDLSFLDRPRPFAWSPEGSGLKLASRFPPLRSEVVALVPGRFLIEAKLVVHRRHVDVFVVHNLPPATPEHHAYFDALALRVRASERAVVVGDLNTTPWNPVFRAFLDEAGLRDGRRGHGRLPTWSAGGWPGSGLPIDHVLVRGDVEVIDLDTAWVEGSDHATLRATLRLGGPGQRTASEPAAPRIVAAAQDEGDADGGP